MAVAGATFGWLLDASWLGCWTPPAYVRAVVNALSPVKRRMAMTGTSCSNECNVTPTSNTRSTHAWRASLTTSSRVAAPRTSKPECVGPDAVVYAWAWPGCSDALWACDLAAGQLG